VSQESKAAVAVGCISSLRRLTRSASFLTHIDGGSRERCWGQGIVLVSAKALAHLGREREGRRRRDAQKVKRELSKRSAVPKWESRDMIEKVGSA